MKAGGGRLPGSDRLLLFAATFVIVATGTVWLLLLASNDRVGASGKYGTAATKEPPLELVLTEPTSLPPLTFVDAGQRPRSLDDFRGRVVLLNVWATWCAPCRREMPSLDRLQATLGGPEFEVVALSIDRSGIAAVRGFFEDIAVKSLEPYVDVSGGAARALGIRGIPATLLVDREGRERGRMTGSAEWDRPELLSVIRQVIGAESHSEAASVRGSRPSAISKPDVPASSSSKHTQKERQ